MTNYPYYPNYFQPQQQTSQQTQNNGILWVQGEAGAKSYLVGAGQSVLLMDAENSTFYIKSTDISGMPLPLRIFDYKERTPQASGQAQAVPMTEYVTREELNKRLAELKEDKE